jgi:thiosulfate/3-mercaptopyruvate sulfurtransferase
VASKVVSAGIIAEQWRKGTGFRRGVRRARGVCHGRYNAAVVALRSPLISAPELAASIASTAPPLVLDLRPAHEFARGAIPGALHLDLWGLSLINTSPEPLAAFTWMIGHLFAQRGVAPDRPVVVYESDSGMRAARAFWFLEYLGHPDVRVLDGGLGAWVSAGLGTSTDFAAPRAGTWHGTPAASKVARWDEVLSFLGRPDVVLVDTRNRAEHLGREVRAKRGGAIPGAVHVEWKENLTADGQFKAPDILRQMYEPIGVTADRTVVTYCQGGYRAAHTYLALRILGYPDVRNYTGSWKEWGDREDLPIATPDAG